jgi:hypothetical protein
VDRPLRAVAAAPDAEDKLEIEPDDKPSARGLAHNVEVRRRKTSEAKLKLKTNLRG